LSPAPKRYFGAGGRSSPLSSLRYVERSDRRDPSCGFRLSYRRDDGGGSGAQGARAARRLQVAGIGPPWPGTPSGRHSASPPGGKATAPPLAVSSTAYLRSFP